MSSDLEGDTNHDGIIDEMDRVRGDLGGDINGLNEQVRNMFDWKAYVRSAPLTSAAAVFCLGFLLAPRIGSRKTVQLAAADARPAGFSGFLNTMIWSSLAKAGSVYVADWVTREFMGSPNGSDSTAVPREPNDPSVFEGEEI